MLCHQVGTLENELGAVLFERHAHGVKLTVEGQRLLDRAASIQRQMDRPKGYTPCGHRDGAAVPHRDLRHAQKRKRPLGVGVCCWPKPVILWLRGLDLNQRPLGYEPNELPDCSTPRLSL